MQADAALLGFLGGLQQRVGAGSASSQFPGWLDSQDFGGSNVLRRMHERDEVRNAPEIDRGTIDALAEVFDFVFADRAIPMQLKIVIGRLQIPVLKAAMIDRDFFLSTTHPARRDSVVRVKWGARYAQMHRSASGARLVRLVVWRP